MPRQPVKLWKCPICGRDFAKNNQAHSCLARAVDDHLRGKDPQVRVVYDLPIARLRELGPLRVDAVKSSINLVSTYHFGSITLRKSYLRLGFISDDVVQDDRIVTTLRLGPKRVHNSVILRSPQDLDAQLLDWLRRAYAASISLRPTLTWSLQAKDRF